MAWLPLADHDPVPGDPFGVGDLGAYFTDEAAKLRAIVAELDRLDAGVWEGEAAEAFTRRRTRLVPHLEALATRWERGGKALKAWAPALDDARTQARKALALAQDADERRIDAQAGLESAREQVAADTRAALLAASTGLAAPAPDASVIPWLERQVAEQEAELAVARTLLGQAQELYETESRRCEAALHAAADDTIENRGGFLAGARRTIHHAVKRFPQIKTFAKYLGLAAGALALAASLFTGVGGLALAAFIVGGLATTLDTALFVSGDGPWTAVAADAFGLLTFGASRAFASAARGTAAGRAIERSDELRRMTSLKGVVAEGASSVKPLTNWRRGQEPTAPPLQGLGRVRVGGSRGPAPGGPQLDSGRYVLEGDQHSPEGRAQS